MSRLCFGFINQNLLVCPICECRLEQVGDFRPLTLIQFRLEANGHLHDPNTYAVLHVCPNGHEVELCQQRSCTQDNCSYRGDCWMMPYADEYAATVL